MSDPFVHFDGAYVLGALSDAERDAFEEHLLTCDACRARVAEIAPIPALLADLTADDFKSAPEPVPDTLLPRLLRAADAQRRRTRTLIGGLGALAAACVAALVLVLAWPSSGGNRDVVAQQMRGAPGVHLTASVRLIEQGSGTKVEVTCRYDENRPGKSPTYTLVVKKGPRAAQNISWWQLNSGKAQTYEGSTNWSPSQISRVEIQLADGTPVLWLDT